jgi:hypothetical protein
MENIESSQNRIDILLSQGGDDIDDVEDLNESQIRGSPSYRPENNENFQTELLLLIDMGFEEKMIKKVYTSNTVYD